MSDSWIVGVGASAGGLEALTLFVANLPLDFPGSIIVAQHLAPKSKSMMVELLARHTQFPVLSAEHGQQIIPGNIYVVPPNVDIDIDDDHIILTEAGPETRPKPSIDYFFSSLARASGDRAIGIILSGTGSDGSEGVRAIHAVGGITIAQDNNSAKYDGMPASAVQTGSIDSVFSPDVIAQNLNEIINNHVARRSEQYFNDSELDQVLKILREKQGRDFTEYKMSTIRRRIARRLQSLRVGSFSDYLKFLEKTPGEVGQLSQELLVSVTTFFRDPEAWDALRPTLEKAIKEKERGSEFRVWVAGCATGEEAYTVAILISEIKEKLRKQISIKVFATDLDQDAILEARNAVFSEAGLVNVPKDIRSKYFIERGGGDVEVNKGIRELVVFARQDLTQNPPFVKLDLITCRNVLIYFTPALQKRVIDTFHYALNPSGILLLGKSEGPISGGTQIFEWIDRKAKVLEKLNVPSMINPLRRMPGAATEALSIPRSTEKPRNLTEKAYSRLLEAYSVAGVVTDKDGNMVHVLGDVSKFVKLSAGIADFRLVSMLPKSIAIEVPILIKKALKAPGDDHFSRIHEMGRGAKAIRFRVGVRSLWDDKEDNQARPFFLVTFEIKDKEKKVSKASIADRDLPQRFAEIEQELHQTREHLQTVVEELGVSNEELQSLNEELSSTNEELQASNEELETTNEELQSSNEELTTLNEEVAAKSSELRHMNAELTNIYSSIGFPLVVVDANMRVIKYNIEALEIFNLSSGFLGADITTVSARCELTDFKNSVSETIRKGQSFESTCEGGGRIYQMRTVPFYDENRRIIGAIISFFDQTELITTQRKLERSESRVNAMINGSTSLISLKDTLGRYILVNNAFEKFHGVKADSIVGKTDRDIFDDQTATSIRDVDLAVILKNQPLEQQETFFNHKRSEASLLVNRFPLCQPGSAEPYAIGTIATDITPQVRAQAALRESENRYKAIVEDQAVFVSRTKPSGEFTYLNAAFSQFFGISNEGKGDSKFFDVVVKPDRERVKAALENITIANPIAQYEHRYIRDGDGQHWIRWIHRGIFDATGKVIEYQAVGFDVTDTKVQTDQLIEQEAIFKSLFSNTSDFITIYRVIGENIVLESLNLSAERSLGVGGQLIGRKLEELIDGSKVNEVLNRYRKAVETGVSQVVDEDFTFLGKRKQFLTTVVPIPAPNGDIERVASISRDVSGYKAIEQDLRNAKQTADVANTAKSDFLAAMSHELRTPLNVVLGMAHLLQETRLDLEQKEFVGSISRSGQLLLSLIEDVLDISKIESGKVRLIMAPFKLGDIAREIGELFSVQAAEKKIELDIKVDRESDLYVLGDANRLRQIIVNLVGNAIKFTDKGRVELKVKLEGQEIAAHQYFRFTVSDTGVGISEEFHHKIFQKFSQAESGASRRFGGSGLGLVISKHLVHQMDGDIGFSSRQGEGTTFWFTARLEVTTKRELERVRKSILSPQPTEKVASPIRILAVDDNFESLNVIRLFLKRLGHNADTVGSGHEAIEKLTQEHYDLVLMDVQMPGMDGFETTGRIRSSKSNFSEVPIIALTANSMAGDQEKCFAAGMNDYISKPVQMDVLRKTLDRWAETLGLTKVAANSEGDQ